MKGQISQYIFVIGVLVIVAITVFTSSTFLGEVELTADYRQNLTGDHEETVRQLAELAERCWTQGRQGGNPQYIDCFRITVNLSEPITQEQIQRQLENLPSNKFRLEAGPLAAGKHTLKVSYLPNEKIVELGEF